MQGVCHRLPGCVQAFVGHLLGGPHGWQDQEPGRGPEFIRVWNNRTSTTYLLAVYQDVLRMEPSFFPF